jgi:hypothetical protein
VPFKLSSTENSFIFRLILELNLFFYHITRPVWNKLPNTRIKSILYHITRPVWNKLPNTRIKSILYHITRPVWNKLPNIDPLISIRLLCKLTDYQYNLILLIKLKISK